MAGREVKPTPIQLWITSETQGLETERWEIYGDTPDGHFQREAKTPEDALRVGLHWAAERGITVSVDFVVFVEPRKPFAPYVKLPVE